MPICSYLVFPVEGEAQTVAADLASLPGCEVDVAENRDVLILVTESEGAEEERELRRGVERTAGIRAIVLTFGNLDTDSRSADSPQASLLPNLPSQGAKAQKP
jgi:nitrate reductase NapAB chaperone NapD